MGAAAMSLFSVVERNREAVRERERPGSWGRRESVYRGGSGCKSSARSTVMVLLVCGERVSVGPLAAHELVFINYKSPRLTCTAQHARDVLMSHTTILQTRCHRTAVHTQTHRSHSLHSAWPPAPNPNNRSLLHHCAANLSSFYDIDNEPARLPAPNPLSNALVSSSSKTLFETKSKPWKTLCSSSFNCHVDRAAIDAFI